MRSLFARFALLLAAGLGAAVAGVVIAFPDVGGWAGPTGQAVALTAAVCVVVALATFALATQRLRRLEGRVAALAAAGFDDVAALPDADAHGDEVARMAAHVEHLGERLAARGTELRRLEMQRHDLLANVAHDLRTPLASMHGYLELLLLKSGHLEPAEERNYLHTALRQSEGLGRLVADLFELTRLESGERRPAPEEVAVAELAHDVAQRFAAEARQRQIALRVTLKDASESGAALLVRADIALLERAIVALVENALLRSPVGAEIGLELGADAGRVRVRVSDAGAAPSPGETASLIDGYLRRDRIGADNVEGGRNGLGLAIAQRIAELHGGELVVERRDGRGARLGFDLPRANGGADQDRPLPAPSVSRATPSSPAPSTPGSSPLATAGPHAARAGSSTGTEAARRRA